MRRGWALPLVCLLFIAAPLIASAASSCFSLEDELGPDPQVLKEHYEKLQELPPVSLDFPDLVRGLKRFWRNVEKKNTHFISLRALDGKHLRHEISSPEYMQKLFDLFAQVGVESMQTLAQWDRVTRSGREKLEAEKHILKSILDRANRVHPSGQPQAQNGKQGQKNKTQNGQGTSNEDQPSGSQPQKSSQDQPSGSQPQKPSQDQPSGSQPQKSSQDQPSGSQPQKSSQDQPSGSQPQKSSQDQPSGSQPQKFETEPRPKPSTSTQDSRDHAGDESSHLGLMSNQVQNFQSPPTLKNRDHKTQPEESTPKQPEAEPQTKFSFRKKWLEGKSEEQRFEKTQPPVHREASPDEVLKTAWVLALRERSSSDELLNSISRFQEFCKGYCQGIDSSTGLSLLSRSVDLMAELETYGVRFNSLEDLFLQIRAQKPDLAQILSFWESLLLETSLYGELTHAEQRLLNRIRNFLRDQTEIPPQDRDMGWAFYQSLAGPLSRLSIERRYNIQGTQGDWSKLVADLKSGNLNMYRLITVTQRYLRLNPYRKSRSKDDLKNTGYLLPIDDHEPTLGPASEYQDLRYVFRNGPPALDIPRLLADDLLKWEYREPVVVDDPRRDKDLIVFWVIFDISDSIRIHEERLLIENALKLGLLDRAQAIQGSGEADVEAIMTAFESSLRPDVTLNNLPQMQSYYEEQIKTPLVSKHGTAITEAIVHAMRRLKKYESSNRKVRGTFLFLTDGEDDKFDMNQIIRAKAALRDDIDINFTTINIAVGNEQFEAATRNGLGEKAFGQYVYKFIDLREIAALQKAATDLRYIEKSARRGTALQHKDGLTEITDLKAAFRGLKETAIVTSSQMRKSQILQALKTLEGSPDNWFQGTELDRLFRFEGSAAQRMQLLIVALESSATANSISLQKLLTKLSATEKQRISQWVQSEESQ